MTPSQIMQEVQSIIDSAKTALLTTIDSEGVAHMRWVSPVCLPGRENACLVYMVTSKTFAKVVHIQNNPAVTWSFQTRDLTKIITLWGTMVQNTSPLLRSEVLEALGPRLYTFWNQKAGVHDLTVLETSVHKALYFIPRTADREIITFSGEVTK